MIRIEHLQVFNFEGAIRGLRNPVSSWDKSDSDVAFHMVENFAPDDPMSEKYREWNDNYGLNIKIGPKDLDLMHRLYKAGTEHRKYLRQIFVSMDITAPLYWWKEFDTYKVGTVANSCSTMHKIHAKEFTLNDFSVEHLGVGMATGVFNDCLETIIDTLNEARSCYLDDKNKMWWWQMIQLLPSSYNQKRTITMNYENVINILKQRSNHKLDEWRRFCDIMLEELPYLKEIISDAKQ